MGDATEELREDVIQDSSTANEIFDDETSFLSSEIVDETDNDSSKPRRKSDDSSANGTIYSVTGRPQRAAAAAARRAQLSSSPPPRSDSSSLRRRAASTAVAKRSASVPVNTVNAEMSALNKKARLALEEEPLNNRKVDPREDVSYPSDEAFTACSQVAPDVLMRSSWKFTYIYEFCKLYRSILGQSRIHIEEFEEAFLVDNNAFVVELIIALLNRFPNNSRNVNANSWMDRLRRFVERYAIVPRNSWQGVFSFWALPLFHRIQIIYSLCDHVVDNEEAGFMNLTNDADAIRFVPIGKDTQHRVYWYFGGTRLYCEYETEKSVLNEFTGMQWELVCRTGSEWSTLMDKLSNSKNKSEKALYAVLEPVASTMAARLLQKERERERKEILQLLPRKRSSRIQDKQRQEEELARQREAERLERERSQREKDMALKAQERLDKEREREERRQAAEAARKERDALQRAERELRQQVQVFIKNVNAGRIIENGNEMDVHGQNVVLNDEKDKEDDDDNHEDDDEDNENPVVYKGDRSVELNIETFTGEDGVSVYSMDSSPNALFLLKFKLYLLMKRILGNETAAPFKQQSSYIPEDAEEVKQSMDLQTVYKKLMLQGYKTVQEITSDFLQIFINCRLYNVPRSEIIYQAIRVERILRDVWAELDLPIWEKFVYSKPQKEKDSAMEASNPVDLKPASPLVSLANANDLKSFSPLVVANASPVVTSAILLNQANDAADRTVQRAMNQVGVHGNQSAISPFQTSVGAIPLMSSVPVHQQRLAQHLTVQQVPTAVGLARRPLPPPSLHLGSSILIQKPILPSLSPRSASVQQQPSPWTARPMAPVWHSTAPPSSLPLISPFTPLPSANAALPFGQASPRLSALGGGYLPWSQQQDK